MLDDAEADVRLSATIVLEEIGTAAVELLLRALGDASWQRRWNAAEMLGLIRDARVVEPLIGALGDAKANVRDNAAWALGRLGSARAVEPLIKTLSDEDPGVRTVAAWALGELGDARAVEPLVRALSDPTSPKTLSFNFLLLPVSFARLHADLKEGRFGNSFSGVAAEALRKIGTPEALAAVEAWEQAQREDES